MKKPLLHLDRLSQADLGKFSVLLSEILTNSQKAKLNTTIPDIMAQTGAFDDVPQLCMNDKAGPFAHQVTAQTFMEAKRFMQAGKKIDAIKIVRNSSDFSLKEAKEYVERYCN